MTRVTFVGMAGKITKLAAGVLMTHYRRSRVDGALLAEVARLTGAGAGGRAGGHGHRDGPPFHRDLPRHRTAGAPRRAVPAGGGGLRSFVAGALAVDVVMVDFDGDEVIGRG